MNSAMEFVIRIKFFLQRFANILIIIIILKLKL